MFPTVTKRLLRTLGPASVIEAFLLRIPGVSSLEGLDASFFFFALAASTLAVGGFKVVRGWLGMTVGQG